MNDIQTNTAVSVSSAVYPSEVLQYASACLEGCYSDYMFFQFDADSYILLVGDMSYSNGVYTFSDFISYQFDIVDVSTAQTYTIPFSGSSSGSQSGGYGGTDGTGGYNGTNSGTVTGNSTLSIVTDKKYNVSYSSVEFQNFPVSVNPNGYMVYSSDCAFPHLIEGVQMYACAAFILAIGVIAFNVADRIFRRVY